MSWPCGCREPRQTSSRHQPVLVNEPSEEVRPPQLRRIGMLVWLGQRPSGLQRRLLIQGAVRAMAVVMAYEFAKNGLELAPMEDEQAIEALAADGPDEALGEGVRARAT